jgi:hypothetical protein
MRERVYRIVWRLGPALIVLGMTACGSTSGSPGKSPSTMPATETVATGPLLGAWWDASSGGLRAVYGVAGAAWQAKATYNDGTYATATVCMRQRIALLATNRGALFLTGLPQGVPVAVGNEASPQAQIVFSPSCSAALAYSPGQSAALLLEGLPAAPHTGSVALPAGTATAAVADSGSVLAMVPQNGGGAAIDFVASGTAATRAVTAVTRFGGMAFLPGADTALVADAGASTVIEAAQVSGNASLTHIAGPADGLAGPIALAVSSDGHRAAIANQKDSSIVRIDLTGQVPAARAVCHCTPTTLVALAGNLAFRVNATGAGTVWAYDGDAVNPRFVFLPAEQSAARGAQP